MFMNRLAYVNILSGSRVPTDIRRTGHGHTPIEHIYAPVTAPCDAAAGHCEGPHIITYADSFSGDRAAGHLEDCFFTRNKDTAAAAAVFGDRTALQLQGCIILQEYGSPNIVNSRHVRSLSAGDDTAGRQTLIGSCMRILGTAVRDGQGRRVRAFLHPEHTAVTGHLEHMAVQVEGQRFCDLQCFSDRDVVRQLDGLTGIYVAFQIGGIVHRNRFRRRRAGGAHQGICYIPRCNKSCPYGQRAYQYQGHQNGEQSSLHGGSSFYFAMFLSRASVPPYFP